MEGLGGEKFPRGNENSVVVSEVVRLHEASSHSAITRWIEERNDRIRKESGSCSRADGYSEEEQDHGEGEDGNGLKEHIE